LGGGGLSVQSDVSAALAAARAAFGEPVIYSRGGTNKTLTAAPGSTERERADFDGLTTIDRRADWLILASDLTDAGLGVPQSGDLITATADAETDAWEVLPIGAEPCYRYRDAERTEIRVHTSLLEIT
tara:strand:- start:4836 stop:5219 length:384 start_codon:yes stop_codon:yes gene_type:complete